MKTFLNLMFFLMNTLQVRQVSYEIIIVSYEICLWFVIWQREMIFFIKNVANGTVTGTSLFLRFIYFFDLSIHENKVKQNFVFYIDYSLHSWNTFQMKHIQVCPFYEILLIRSFMWKHFCTSGFFLMNTRQVLLVSYENIIVFIWNLIIIL